MGRCKLFRKLFFEGKKIYQTKCIPFSNFTNILSCYTVKRSRYANSSHTKYVSEKHPHLPSKSLKKETKPWNSPKSKPATLQVFYPTRSFITYILQQFFLKKVTLYSIFRKRHWVISCHEYLWGIILVSTSVLCLKRILCQQVYRKKSCTS